MSNNRPKLQEAQLSQKDRSTLRVNIE